MTSRVRLHPFRNQQKPPDTDIERLIVTRVQVARMLSVSEFTVRRLEKAGVLKSFKLTSSPSANVYFRLSDVHAFIEERAGGR